MTIRKILPTDRFGVLRQSVGEFTRAEAPGTAMGICPQWGVSPVWPSLGLKMLA